MIRNIIIEGPNNVGKTTLINRLLALDTFEDWTTEHLDGTYPNTKDFYDTILSNSNNTIFDRCHIGELIYPKLYNREQKLTYEEALELSKKHSDVLLIFLDADISFICEACEYKNEEFNTYDVMFEKQSFWETYNTFKTKISNCLYFKNTKNNEWEYQAFIDEIVERIQTS